MFQIPERISPFYKDVKRIPRKLKKEMKKKLVVHWSGLTNEERLWHYMEFSNPRYKEFLIGLVIYN